MKPPELIKKGLACCSKVEGCQNRCPYYDLGSGSICVPAMTGDALAYIQQLESRLAQVERERDAAVHDLKLADRVDCDFCKHQYGGCTYDGCKDCSKPCPCGSCRNSSNYEWRGVCEANTEEGTK